MAQLGRKPNGRVGLNSGPWLASRTALVDPFQTFGDPGNAEPPGREACEPRWVGQCSCGRAMRRRTTSCGRSPERRHRRALAQPAALGCCAHRHGQTPNRRVGLVETWRRAADREAGRSDNARPLPNQIPRLLPSTPSSRRRIRSCCNCPRGLGTTPSPSRISRICRRTAGSSRSYPMGLPRFARRARAALPRLPAAHAGRGHGPPDRGRARRRGAGADARRTAQGPR